MQNNVKKFTDENKNVLLIPSIKKNWNAKIYYLALLGSKIELISKR